MYQAWVIAKEPDFNPTRWTDNPKEGKILINATLEESISHDEAVAMAQGFNEAELRLPCGFWVMVTKDQFFEIGQTIKIEHATELN